MLGTIIYTSAFIPGTITHIPAFIRVTGYLAQDVIRIIYTSAFIPGTTRMNAGICIMVPGMNADVYIIRITSCYRYPVTRMNAGICIIVLGGCIINTSAFIPVTGCYSYYIYICIHTGYHIHIPAFIRVTGYLWQDSGVTLQCISAFMLCTIIYISAFIRVTNNNTLVPLYTYECGYIYNTINNTLVPLHMTFRVSVSRKSFSFLYNRHLLRDCRGQAARVLFCVSLI